MCRHFYTVRFFANEKKSDFPRDVSRVVANVYFYPNVQQFLGLLRGKSDVFSCAKVRTVQKWRHTWGGALEYLFYFLFLMFPPVPLVCMFLRSGIAEQDAPASPPTQAHNA